MRKHLTYFVLLIVLSALSAYAQSEEELLQQVNIIKGDSNRIIVWQQLANVQVKNKNYEKALVSAQSGLTLANKIGSKYLAGDCQLIIGNISVAAQNYPNALNNYLVALISFESLGKKSKIAETSIHLASLYQRLKNHQKTIDYANRSESIFAQEQSILGQEYSLDLMGNAYIELENWAKAEEIYLKLLALQEKNNLPQRVSTLGKLSVIAKNNNKTEEALRYTEKKFDYYKEKKDLFSAAQAANNLGFLYRKLNQPNKAIDAFNDALAFFKQLNNEARQENAVILNNIGVTYSNLGDYKKARLYFADALKINEKNNHIPKQVDSYNYLAAIDYIGSNNSQALANALKAVEIGEPAQSYAELIETYQILSEIYARDNDFKKSNEALKKQQELQALLDKKLAEQAEKERQNQMNLVKQEGDLINNLNEKERQDQQLKNLKLDSARRASQLELQKQKLLDLEREQQLKNATLRAQQLQREQAEQALAIAEQKLAIERTNAEKAQLAQEKDLAAIKAKEQEFEKKEQQRAIQILEAGRKQQEDMLKQKETTEKFGIGLLILILLVLLVIIYAFIQRQKASKLLANQQIELKRKNEELLSSEEELRQNMEELRSTQESMRIKQIEIERVNEKLLSSESILRKALEKTRKQEQELRQKNEQLLTNEEELRQNMEELQTTQEALELRKNELDNQNQKVTQSIRYAKQIQAAVLPTLPQRLAVFPDSFLIFRPKDIVSGDFYWISQHPSNQRIVAVVDCTGHGVPGAFMSLVGNNILNEIINQKDIYQPDQILMQLHKGVRKKLSQEEGANNDGMDLGLCLIEDIGNQQFRLTYSGAKHKLYLIHQKQLVELRSDRKSIGGSKSEHNRSFTQQEIVLDKGDLIYLTTDGFIDQANEERKSFTSKKLQEVLSNIWQLDLAHQQVKLEEALEAHQQKTEQRDDITLLGIRL